jgi:hypothetical protein
MFRPNGFGRLLSQVASNVLRRPDVLAVGTVAVSGIKQTDHSLKSPACLCVSIALPPLIQTRITALMQNDWNLLNRKNYAHSEPDITSGIAARRAARHV